MLLVAVERYLAARDCSLNGSDNEPAMSDHISRCISLLDACRRMEGKELRKLVCGRSRPPKLLAPDLELCCFLMCMMLGRI